ncbi:MAG: hypothetical protein JRJ44_06130 [Deltaproteobacteria bacterium]|nr:hypothetical protein [Deltaproteobacteria bacterium]
MPKYYIDKKSDSNIESVIHREGCKCLKAENKDLLGCFSNYYDAVEIAKIQGYLPALDCDYCSSEYIYRKYAKHKR